MIAAICRILQIVLSTALWRGAVNQCTHVCGATLRMIDLLSVRRTEEIISDREIIDHTSPSQTTTDSTSTDEVLMIGNTSITCRIGNRVRKRYSPDSDTEITKANIQAAKNEANVYLILGQHPRIAKYLFICPAKTYIDLEFYSRGTLRDYIRSNRSNISNIQLKRWAYLLIESVAYIHSKGVRHADLRLDQWLLDEDLQPRLADFNGSGFDAQPELGLDHTTASSIEVTSHCLPRDFDDDSTVTSDIFALGSSLYELETDSRPFEGEEENVIELKFSQQIFPPVNHLLIGDVILGCWNSQYASAEQILSFLRR